jgi:hypothetical protein
MNLRLLPGYQYKYIPHTQQSCCLTYCYMCEVSLVVALALLQQCNSTTPRFLSYATILGK